MEHGKMIMKNHAKTIKPNDFSSRRVVVMLAEGDRGIPRSMLLMVMQWMGMLCAGEWTVGRTIELA